MLRQLAAFRKEHGYIRVDEHWKRYPELAGWIVAIRGQLETLTYDQIVSLNDLGFFNRLDREWLAKYARLQIFKDTMGHCDVPARWSKNPALSVWVHNHRGKVQIVPWRRKLLSDLGFNFRLVDKSPPIDWDDGIKRLKQYKERFGNCDVPARWSEDKSLGLWLSRLRKRDVKRSLGDEKIRQLDNLGFDWNPLRSAWELKLKELKAFKEQHGHCRVSLAPSGLGCWVGNIRQTKEKLSEKRIRKLNQIGFDWNPYETYWNTQYESLLDFKQRFGHANVPARWKENRELACWVSDQRTKKAELPPDRMQLLEDAGIDWDPNETAWIRHYEELIKFSKEHGHCNTPMSQSLLRKWVDHQRNKVNKMPKHRKKLLDEIGFMWTGYQQKVWMQRYEELKDYKVKHGHCSPAARSSALANWVAVQRIAKAKMLPERRQLLNEIGFVWQINARR